ncbi:MAG: hypothetical protein H7Y59_12150 [Anaerolineales bacterium]|nr:hypothetical protein [Anaerolineales bacterium]
MKNQKQISTKEAKCIGDSLYIDWEQVDLEQFRQGLMGHRKKATLNSDTRLIYDGVLLTGRLVLAHMQQFPDYVIRLARLRAEVNKYKNRRMKRTQAPV